MGRRLASNHELAELHHSKLVLLDLLFQSYTEDLPTLRRTLVRSDMKMLETWWERDKHAEVLGTVSERDVGL